MKASLHDVEKWMVSAITGAAVDAENPDRWLTRSSRLDAAGRFDVYRSGYRARLVECLTDDYPILARALGTDRFEALCLGYIERHPSTGPNLNFFGRHMAAFCREAADFDDVRAFASELAALEWALVEVLHEEMTPPLDVAELAALPVEAWAGARLVKSAGLRLFRFRYPVNAYYQASRDAEDEPAEVAIPAEAPSAVAVYRKDLLLWRMNLTAPMMAVLEPIVAGKTIGDALGDLEATADAATLEAVGKSLMVWFREWVSAGFFSHIARRIPPEAG